MNWFGNLRTRTKLVLGFGLVLVLLMAVIGSSHVAITAIRESQRRLFEVESANAIDLELIRSNQSAIRAAIFGMMVATKRSDQEAMHQGIKTHTQVVDEAIPRVMKRAKDDAKLLSRLEEFDSTRKAFRHTRETETIPLIYAGKLEEAKAIVLGVQSERDRKMQAIADELVEEAKVKSQRALAQSTEKANQSLRLSVIVGLLAIVLSVAMVAVLNQMVARPLMAISGIASQVAEGDLTVNVATNHRADEVGALTLTFSKMVSSLRGVTSEITEGMNVLASSSSEISALTSQLASGAMETATAVTQSTSTVEEVKQTAQLSAQKSRSVSEISQRAVEGSQAGEKSVEETIATMNRIREQMESVAESMMRLSEQSQAIGEIVSTVNDLADQSNLLAVNASIEAARAGEQGKGFAVVAQEIQSLAEQSKQATSQVRTILNDIQKATSAAVMAIEQASKAVAAGVEQSAKAGEAIRLLTDSITEAAQATVQIAASSQQQLTGMDQVALAMENIKQASAQTAESTKQAEAAARNLHELGQRLKQLVGRYKV